MECSIWVDNRYYIKEMHLSDMHVNRYIVNRDDDDNTRTSKYKNIFVFVCGFCDNLLKTCS